MKREIKGMIETDPQRTLTRKIRLWDLILFVLVAATLAKAGVIAVRYALLEEDPYRKVGLYQSANGNFVLYLYNGPNERGKNVMFHLILIF